MTDFRFFHPVEIRYADLDPQGHVNNARYLTYFEQARMAYLRELGLFSVGQSFEEIGVIVADIHVRYKEPLTWGNAIRVGVATTRLGTKSLTQEQCIQSPSGDRTFATGSVVLVAYDYTHRASMRLQEAWRSRLQAYEGTALK